MYFHVDDFSYKDAAKFKDLLLEFGLHQHLPTHRDGHTPDLFITRMSDNTTLDKPVASYYICNLPIKYTKSSHSHGNHNVSIENDGHDYFCKLWSKLITFSMLLIMMTAYPEYAILYD